MGGDGPSIELVERGQRAATLRAYWWGVRRWGGRLGIAIPSRLGLSLARTVNVLHAAVVVSFERE